MIGSFVRRIDDLPAARRVGRYPARVVRRGRSTGRESRHARGGTTGGRGPVYVTNIGRSGGRCEVDYRVTGSGGRRGLESDHLA